MLYQSFKQKMSECCPWHRLWGGPRNAGPSANSGTVPLTIPSSVRTGQAWCVCRPTHVRARPTIVPVRVASHQKLLQLEPYAGPYCTKSHEQHESKHRRGPRSLPNPLSGHPPGHLSPRRTGVLTQRPHKRIRWGCLTGARQHWPRVPALTDTIPPNLPHLRPSGETR